MARSTFGVFLMEGTGASTLTYSKLCDIKDFPDLGGDPSQIDVTTLSDYMRKYVGGLEETTSLAFTANYDKTTYNTLRGKEGAVGHFAVWFGYSGTKQNPTPDGSDGKFSFDAELYVRVSGAGVAAPVDMVITLMPTSVISFATT